MSVLAIDTATVAVAVALADESGLCAAVELRAGRRHAELLHVAIEMILESTGSELGDVEGVAVDIGPGLFTGIRVGVAAAKGFAMALGVPAVGLTSLEILQLGCAAAGQDHAVAVVDLRRGEVAWRMPAGVGGDRHGPPGELVTDVSRLLGGREQDRHGLVLAGDGAIRHAEMLTAALPSVHIAGPELAVPPVGSLALAASRELTAGRGVDPIEIAPLYLRDADVRINWTTRHDAPGRRAGVA
jgi:tRNA threonylcarbamoyladenosine biosynthesis protein TsaB